MRTSDIRSCITLARNGARPEQEFSLPDYRRGSTAGDEDRRIHDAGQSVRRLLMGFLDLPWAPVLACFGLARPVPDAFVERYRW